MSESVLHVYWKGARIEGVTVEHGDGSRTVLPNVVQIHRRAEVGQKPMVEVAMYARLVEHRPSPVVDWEPSTASGSVKRTIPGAKAIPGWCDGHGATYYNGRCAVCAGPLRFPLAEEAR